MSDVFFPLKYLLATAALWLNRQQQHVIDYLKEENGLLKEKLGDHKLHFSDAVRCLLAATRFVRFVILLLHDFIDSVSSRRPRRHRLSEAIRV